jgi:hypothetical protein
MDDHILDLDNLTALLTRVLQQMERRMLEQVAAVVDKSTLEEMLLEAIGVPRQRLSLEEQDKLTAMVESVLYRLRSQAGCSSGNPFHNL